MKNILAFFRKVRCEIYHGGSGATAIVREFDSTEARAFDGMQFQRTCKGIEYACMKCGRRWEDTRYCYDWQRVDLIRE